MTESELRNDLNKFTKSQIINAIVRTFPYRGISERLIANLEHSYTEELISKHSYAIEEESEATKEYIKWRGDMVDKYGDNGQVWVCDIPMGELMKGVELENRMESAREKERKLNKMVDNVLFKKEEVIH